MGKLLQLNRAASQTEREAMLAAVAADAAQADRHGGDLSVALEQLRATGWLRACLHRAAGGEGWGCEPAGTLPALQALREIGRANLSMARLFEGHMNAVKLLTLYGSPQCQARVTAEVFGGTLLGVWGADVFDEPVRVNKAEDDYELTGTKRFASGLGLVGEAVVTARLPDGETQLALVSVDESERGDASGWRMAGMRATQSGTYHLTGTAVQADNLLGRPDAYFTEPHFEGGIWRYCAAHLGAAERLYELVRDGLVKRRREADPVQQGRIAHAAIAVETTRLWLVRAAEAVEAPGASPRTATLSLLAREVTERACRKVLTLTEQALGMAAHEEGAEVERIRRDLGLFLCQAAPDAKRARAAQALVEMRVLPEAL